MSTSDKTVKTKLIDQADQKTICFTIVYDKAIIGRSIEKG